MARFDVDGNYWLLIADNGERVATGGESFDSPFNARRAAETFKANASAYAYDVYSDSGDRYRWRAMASNGRRVASSGESFASRSNARRAADAIPDIAEAASGP